MTALCPDWPSLVEQRSRVPDRDPAGWREALAHLRGCPGCRRRAAAVDPLLLLQSAPVEIDPQRVEALQERVQASLRARRAEALVPRRATARAVAAGLLAVGLLTAQPPSREAGGPDAATVQAMVDQRPVLEGTDRAFDQVVEWSNDDFTLVLFVDERLDV